MCGIVGYIGTGGATEFLVEGLRRLEYRGYDSAGIGTITADRRVCGHQDAGPHRRAGQGPGTGIPADGRSALATRVGPRTVRRRKRTPTRIWIDTQAIAVVHNGVIENFRQLRERLEQLGHTFRLGDRQRSDCAFDQPLSERSCEANAGAEPMQP